MSNPVIENIRCSLGRTEQTLIDSRPPIYPSRQTGSPASEIQLFFDEIKKLSGNGQQLDPDEIAEALKTIIVENNIRTATLWHTSLIDKLGICELLRTLDVELISPTAEKHEIALCDLGITEADYILPETGTIVLHASADIPRAVSLLPRVHLAIVRPDMLRPDIHEVFTEVKNHNYLVFITGPSRTADIELTTTLGVHGPKQLFVWMVGR